MKIAIIGLGNVGSSLSFALMGESYVTELVLYDIRKDYAWAVFEDLTHASAVLERSIKITLVKSLEEIENVDLIIIAAGVKRKPGMSRRDLATVNANTIKEIVEGTMERNRNAFYLLITNPVDAMATLAYNVLGKKNVVIGSGTSLDTARFRVAIARELGISPIEVSGFVGGEHGEAAVMLWSTVNINGIPLEEYLNTHNIKVDKQKIERYVKAIAGEIIKYQNGTKWGPGYVFRDIIRAFAKNENRVLSVAAPFYLDEIGEEVFVSIPRIVGRRLGKDLFNQLTEDERKGIIEAAKAIYQTYQRAVGVEK